MDDLKAFELFNNCQPMRLLVEGLHDDAKRIGLTEGRLVAAVESRLRSARLYVEDDPWAAVLYVNVHVVGPAYTTSVEYYKLVVDAFGNVGEARTWTTGGAGTHGRDPSFVVAGLAEYLDRFLVAYLRVNESACS